MRFSSEEAIADAKGAFKCWMEAQKEWGQLILGRY